MATKIRKKETQKNFSPSIVLAKEAERKRTIITKE